MKGLTRGFTWLTLLCVAVCMATLLVLLPAVTVIKSLHDALTLVSLILSASIKMALCSATLAGVCHILDERNAKTNPSKD